LAATIETEKEMFAGQKTFTCCVDFPDRAAPWRTCMDTWNPTLLAHGARLATLTSCIRGYILGGDR